MAGKRRADSPAAKKGGGGDVDVPAAAAAPRKPPARRVRTPPGVAVAAARAAVAARARVAAAEDDARAVQAEERTGKQGGDVEDPRPNVSAPGGKRGAPPSAVKLADGGGGGAAAAAAATPARKSSRVRKPSAAAVAAAAVPYNAGDSDDTAAGEEAEKTPAAAAKKSAATKSKSGGGGRKRSRSASTTTPPPPDNAGDSDDTAAGEEAEKTLAAAAKKSAATKSKSGGGGRKRSRSASTTTPPPPPRRRTATASNAKDSDARSSAVAAALSSTGRPRRAAAVAARRKVKYQESDEESVVDDDGDDDYGRRDAKDDAGDLEDDDEVECVPKTKKKKKGKTKRKSSTTSSQSSSSPSASASKTKKKPGKMGGDAAKTTCPNCGKAFSKGNGLRYHTQQAVCRNPDDALVPFAQLSPGERFVTPYGIAEVVSDSRPPPVPPSCADPAGAARDRAWHLVGRYRNGSNDAAPGKRIRYARDERERRKTEARYVQSRTVSEWRRSTLSGLWSDRRRRGGGNVPTRREVWTAHGFAPGRRTPCAALWDGTIRANAWEKLLEKKKGDDEGGGATEAAANDGTAAKGGGARNVPSPRRACESPGEPFILHPDRVVECVLVPDERPKVQSLAAAAKGRRGGASSSSTVPAGSVSAAYLRPRLFLRRTMLEEPYQPNRPSYSCGKCSMPFNSVQALRSHCLRGPCTSRVREPWQSLVQTPPIKTNTAGGGARTKTGASASTPPSASARAARKRTSPMSGTKTPSPRPRKRSKWINPSVELAKLPPSERPESLLIAPHTGKTLKGKPRRNAMYAEHGDKPWLTEGKRNKRPSWLEFRPAESCWYIEVYKTLAFKRGANNTKWIAKKRERNRFSVATPDSRQRRKTRQRLEGKGLYPQVTKQLGLLRGVRESSMYANVYEMLGFEKGRKNQIVGRKVKRVVGTALSDAHIVGDEDRSYETYRAHAQRLRLDGLAEQMDEEAKERREAAKLKRRRKIAGKARRDMEEMERAKMAGGKRRSRRGRAVKSEEEEERGRVAKTKAKSTAANAPPGPLGPIVDALVLVEEIDNGRYTSMRRFRGAHNDTCCFCTAGPGPGRLHYCAICPNAEHWECLRTKHNVRRPAGRRHVALAESTAGAGAAAAEEDVAGDDEDDEDFLCHVCMGRVLTSRKRAEKRRLAKRAKALEEAGVVVEQQPLTEEMEMEDVTAATAMAEAAEDAPLPPLPEATFPDSLAAAAAAAMEEAAEDAPLPPLPDEAIFPDAPEDAPLLPLPEAPFPDAPADEEWGSAKQGPVVAMHLGDGDDEQTAPAAAAQPAVLLETETATQEEPESRAEASPMASTASTEQKGVRGQVAAEEPDRSPAPVDAPTPAMGQAAALAQPPGPSANASASANTGAGCAPCPSGGPGGLICCAPCSASYSRNVLDRAARETETRAVARAGREMGELLELLADARARLGRAVDVSRRGEEARRLIFVDDGLLLGLANGA